MHLAPRSGCAGRRRRRPGRCRRRAARCRAREAATATPIAPVPQQRSTTTGAVRTSARTSTARSTSGSVRRRGTKTPGATAIRSPQNSAQPSDLLQRLARHPAREHQLEVAARRGPRLEQRGLLLGEHAPGSAQRVDDLRVGLSRRRGHAARSASARPAPRGPRAGRGRRPRSRPWCPRRAGRRGRATRAPARTRRRGRPRPRSRSRRARGPRRRCCRAGRTPPASVPA